MDPSISLITINKTETLYQVNITKNVFYYDSADSTDPFLDSYHFTNFDAVIVNQTHYFFGFLQD